METRRVIVLTAIFLIELASVFYLFGFLDRFLYSESAHTETQVIHIGGRQFRVAIADTPEERTRGLSGQNGLAPDGGMLFIFESDRMWAFWMKDMKFPIDILWLSADKRIVHIEEGVSPQSYPRSFEPSEPARYVLELPAGSAKRYTIVVGSLAAW